jgi:hypothetical protein
MSSGPSPSPLVCKWSPHTHAYAKQQRPHSTHQRHEVSGVQLDLAHDLVGVGHLQQDDSAAMTIGAAKQVARQ